MTIFVWAIFAENTQSVALEHQGEAELLNGALDHLLPDEMVNEDGVEPVLIRVVASRHPIGTDVLKVALNADAAHIEPELKLPKSETYLL